MKDKGISAGLVQKFDTSSKLSRGAFYGFRKMFWEYLNKLNVPFFDPCCPEASTAWMSSITGTTQTIAAGSGGALATDSRLSNVSTDAGGDAFTLADGTVPGQQKEVMLVTDGGGDAVITPASLKDATTVTLNDAGDYVVFAWDGAEWNVVTNSGGVVA